MVERKGDIPDPRFADATGDEPMSREDMRAWLRLHGVEDAPRMDTLLATYAGKTEDEMDALNDAAHGDMA